jgi:hypothetical protein
MPIESLRPQLIEEDASQLDDAYVSFDDIDDDQNTISCIRSSALNSDNAHTHSVALKGKSNT